MTRESLRRVPLGTVAREVKRRSRTASPLPVFAVTKHQGFVPSLEYFKKQVYSRDTKGYVEMREGEIAYATIHLDEGSIGVSPANCIISPMYTGFAVDTSKVLPDFLARYLKSPEALAGYPLLGNGSVHRRRAIPFTRLSTIQIPLPPLAEQKRIAAILDAADALRAKRREALAQLDSLVQSTFLDMFGDPVTNPKGFPTKILAEFYVDEHEGTRCGPFGSALKKDELVESGVPVWNMDNIDPSGRVALPFRMFIAEEKYRKLRAYFGA